MDVVIEGVTIVTMDAEERVLKDRCVGVEGGRIVDIKKRLGGEAEHLIDGKGKLLLPGLVNAHTHLPMTLLRGIADDIPLMTWLQEHIWPIEANLTEAHIRAGSDLGIAEMIKSGTTCFNDMYWHMETVAERVERSGIRAALATPLLDIMGPEQGGKLLKEGESLINKFRGHEMITPFLGPHSPYTCSEELLLGVNDLQEKYGIGAHIHMSETREEVERIKKEKGKPPFEYLDGLGFLNPHLVASHSVWVSEKEIEIMTRRGVNVVHNPVSNMKIAAGVAPVTEYLKKGITVGLGTDGAASNNSLDMFGDMKMAALVHKVHTNNPQAVPAKTVVEMATIRGARALGLDSELGSIEIGKRADIILVDLKKPHLTPLTHPISHIVYAARGSDVSHTIVNGKILMEDYMLTTLDEQTVIEEANKQTVDLLAKSEASDKLF